MASEASDASRHRLTTVFPGPAPQVTVPVAEARVDETRGGKGELSATRTTAGDRALETSEKVLDTHPLDIFPEFVLREKSWACRGRFKQCLSILTLVHYDWLEQRSAEFNWWTSGLNADKNGPGSLDARLSLRPDVTAVIVDALDGLDDALSTYYELATSDRHSLTEADGDSTASDEVDRVPSPWSDMSSGGGEGPASAVSDGEEDDEEIEDAETQRKDAHLPLSSDDYAEQRAYIENNLLVLIRIHTAIKLSGLKLRNKRADDALKQAEQEYERQKLTIGAHKALASQDGEHERFRRYFTKLVLRNGYTEDLIRGLSSRIYHLAKTESCQGVRESRDLEDSQDSKSSQDARELHESQTGESYEVLLQKKLLVVLRAYLYDPARLTTVQRRLVDANIVRRNRLVHAGSARKTSSHATKARTEPTPQIQPLNKSLAPRSSLMAVNITSSSYNLVPSTESRPVTQSNQGSQTTKSFVAQPATALESRFSITGALIPTVRSTARSAGTKMSARVGHLDYPKCPKEEDGPFPCDYCPMILSPGYRKKEKWRGHVAQDLCGYVCVFEDCESPEDMFASTYEWMSHMARFHSEVEWVCPLCANHRLPADDIQAASFLVRSQLQDHILACHPATGDDGGLTELELVVSAGQRAVGIRKVRCPLCRPGLVTSEEDIDGSVPSPLSVGQAAGLVQLEEDQHIATHIHEFALHAFPSADGEELPEEARKSVPSEPSTSVDMNIERLRRPESSFQVQAFANTIANTQDVIEELNAAFLKVQASDWIQAESSVRLDVMAVRLDNLFPSLQLAQEGVDLDRFAWELNECQVLVSQLSDTSPNSDTKGPQTIDLLEELDEKLRQLTSLCETGRQREGQQLSPPSDLPFDQKKPSSPMNTTLISNSSLRKILRNEELEIINPRDATTYKWIPKSSIDEIFVKYENFEVEDNVKGFITKQAKKLFSLLVRHGHVKWLSLFHANEFGDNSFPIKFRVDRRSQVWTLQSCESDKESHKAISFRVSEEEVNGISIYDRDSLEDFCDHHQWLIFVPIFSPDDRAHVFDPLCRMPFLKEFESHDTNFSIVRHFVIHQSHLNFPRDDQIGTMVDDEDNPHVAVKEILSVQGLTSEKFEELAKNEATILKRLRDQNHPHLIRAIASYTRGNRHFFVFPWARGGNLRNFWKLQPSLSAPSVDVSNQDWNKYLEWFFEQLLGLASAIRDLHHPRNAPDESCRHGDLKPENILCFSKNENDIGEGRIPTGVILVVADAGHAKVHEKATEFRFYPTATPKGTTMYSPPEADIEQARTRRYDIWSLGCLYLESLIWMMYGYDALKSFHRDVGPGEPYFVKDPPMDLKDAVKEWMKAIKNDDRCAPIEKTAVGRHIMLIEKRMLVGISAPKGSDMEQTVAPELIVKRATMYSAAFSKDDFGRADANEVYEEMKKIFDAGKQNQDLTWMIRDAETSVRGPPIITRGLAPDAAREPPGIHESLETRTDISDSKQRDYQFLDDVWTYNADNETALAIIPDSIEKRTKLKDSVLCGRCSNLKIWFETCEFLDTLAGLESRSKSCELCRLLHRELTRRAAQRSGTVKFRRSGSYLMFGERHCNPVLSLCHSTGKDDDLGSYGTPPNDAFNVDSEALTLNKIELGFPFRLVPGDKTHVRILAKWVRSCDNARHLPEGQQFIPTRLLLVGDETTTCVRLVTDLAKESVRVKYVVLSHRWGRAPPIEGKFATTTKDNIGLITASRGVDDACLPQTFQDAVIITRKLGVKYLWIDALCVLQRSGQEHDTDARDDAERESKLMDEIFGSAHLTIAASCASHRFEGFLKPRAPRQFVTMKTEDGGQFHICEIIDNFEADVEQGELNQSGWVLQERALSRRTLHFTSTQTYWECGEGIRCETFNRTVNRKAHFLGDSNFPYFVESFKQVEQLGYYHDLYERYSSLNFAFATDRPRAIAGLEKRLMKALNSTGSYGIFQSNFHRDLLWQRRNTRPTLKRIAFDPEERVPSWSWMAFDGEIRYMDIPFGDLEKTTDISSPFQGHPREISHMASSTSGKGHFRARVCKLMTENPAGMILDEDRVLPGPLMCVIIGSSRRHGGEPLRHYALIVTPIEGIGEEQVVERVGVAYLSVKDVSLEDDAGFMDVR